MFRHIGWCAALALALAGCTSGVVDKHESREVSEIRTIRIDYQHLGWGHEQEGFSLVPAASSPDFVLLARYEGSEEEHDIGQRVPRRAVEELLAAASASAWPRATGVRAVASAFKRAQISNIEPATSFPPRACTSQELKRLARVYVKRKGIPTLIDEHYGRGISWTDDYPHAQLQILFRNGRPLRMYTDSQKAMMLPWYRGVSANSPPESDQNWSLALSQALRTVLPRDSSMYERLGAGRLLGQLKSNVQHHVDNECDAMRNARDADQSKPQVP